MTTPTTALDFSYSLELSKDAIIVRHDGNFRKDRYLVDKSKQLGLHDELQQIFTNDVDTIYVPKGLYVIYPGIDGVGLQNCDNYQEFQLGYSELEYLAPDSKITAMGVDGYGDYFKVTYDRALATYNNIVLSEGWFTLLVENLNVVYHREKASAVFLDFVMTSTTIIWSIFCIWFLRA